MARIQLSLAYSCIPLYLQQSSNPFIRVDPFYVLDTRGLLCLKNVHCFSPDRATSDAMVTRMTMDHLAASVVKRSKYKHVMEVTHETTEVV